MSDDIVTQLRGISNTKEWVKLRDWTIITREAADEIERLRAEVSKWEGAAERFAESDPKFDAWVYYFKARRNEQG
jgi:hypothetical protein